jgi:hypothetical protein
MESVSFSNSQLIRTSRLKAIDWSILENINLNSELIYTRGYGIVLWKERPEVHKLENELSCVSHSSGVHVIDGSATWMLWR